MFAGPCVPMGSTLVRRGQCRSTRRGVRTGPLVLVIRCAALTAASARDWNALCWSVCPSEPGSALVLSRKPRQPGPHRANHRLQLGVGLLPEVHEPAVVVACLGAVAARLVE